MAICRIPLSRRYVPDVMVWLHNKNGVCSVKSSYHIARLLLKEAGCEGESFSSNVEVPCLGQDMETPCSQQNKCFWVASMTEYTANLSVSGLAMNYRR